MPAPACLSKLIVARSAEVLSRIARCIPALVVLAGCSRTPPPPPPKPPRPPAAPRASAGFNFATPSLKAIATRFDAAATGMCDSNWSTSPLTRRAWDSRVYAASWELLETGNVEHKIELQLSSSHRLPDQIRSVSIWGRHYPSREWGAFVAYTVIQEPSESLGVFQMEFTDDARPGGPAPPFVLTLPGRVCEAIIRERNLSLSFRIQTVNDGYQPITSVNEDIRAYLASPEALRRSALKELATLETKVRQDIQSGAAWVGVVNLNNVRSDNPPRERPPKQNESLTPALKAEALEALLGEIE